MTTLMKLWRIDFGWEPGSIESLVILAETEERAIATARGHDDWPYEYSSEEDGEICVKVEKFSDEENWNWRRKEFTIVEVDVRNAGVVYVGSYCC